MFDNPYNQQNFNSVIPNKWAIEFDFLISFEFMISIFHTFLKWIFYTKKLLYYQLITVFDQKITFVNSQHTHTNRLLYSKKTVLNASLKDLYFQNQIKLGFGITISINKHLRLKIPSTQLNLSLKYNLFI